MVNMDIITPKSLIAEYIELFQPGDIHRIMYHPSDWLLIAC